MIYKFVLGVGYNFEVIWVYIDFFYLKFINGVKKISRFLMGNVFSKLVFVYV